MTDRKLINRLFDLWQDEVDAGRTPDLSRLCAEHPEALGDLQVRVAAFEKMDRGLRGFLKEETGTSGPADTSDSCRSDTPEDAVVSTEIRYRILEQHAKGGLGEVLIAEDQILGRRVAVKRMQNGHTHD